MKALASGMLVISLTVIGCTKESAPGGPGVTNGRTTAKDKNSEKSPGVVTSEEQTFTVKVPATNVNIKQGEQDEVTISLDRGEKFNQKVTLKFEPAAGLVVTPNTITIEPGQDDDVTLKIAAEATAQVGQATINVNATPETGKAVSEKFMVDVVEKDGATEAPSSEPTP